MKEIYFCFFINAPLDTVLEAVSSTSGLASWWTKNLEVTGTIGSISTFRFKSGAFNKMKIIRAEPSLIEWLCIDGHKEWIGTHVTFELDHRGKETKVCFSHFGFKEQTEYIGECSFHWAKYMISLQRYCKTGIGMPDEGR